MAYTLTTGTSVTRDADGAGIPDDPRNADWQAYQAWLAAGDMPNPYVAPPAPPPTLSFLQFMALFTSAEQDAIVNSADTQTKLFMMMATGSGGLQLTNPEVVGGVNYLASTSTVTPPGPGLITAARAAQILAGQAPS
jgi:hypothetical protein